MRSITVVLLLAGCLFMTAITALKIWEERYPTYCSAQDGVKTWNDYFSWVKYLPDIFGDE